MPISRKVIVKGIVQGVSFRESTAGMAAELKISGWVRNCTDGSLEACFEGTRKEVEALVSWCFVGPKRSVVDEVIVERRRYRGRFRGFRILAEAESSTTVMTMYKMAV